MWDYTKLETAYRNNVDFTFLAELVVCLAIGAIASLLLGQDANWDLRNYHLYNPYAFLNGRETLDLLPAGLQSTFNPLLDVPYYVLATGILSRAPRVLAAVAGLPFGALMFATLRLAGWMFGSLTGIERLLPWLVVGIAGPGAVTTSEIGTTFNDIPIAALLLGGFVVGVRQPPARWSLAPIMLAGAMIGSAVALKLTAAAIAPGIAAGLLVDGHGRGRLRKAVALGTSCLVMMVIFAGPWALTLTRIYKNPVFPLANNIFRSEWYPPIAILDLRFLPRTLGQTLFYPFYWITRHAMLVTEPPFRDARLAIAMLALPVLGVSVMRVWLPHPQRVAAVLVASVLGYVVWLYSFGILRYAIVLEAFSALLIVTLLRTIVLFLAPKRHGVSVAVGALIFVALSLYTESPNWWRVPYGERVFDIDRIHLPTDSLVLAINGPVAMVLPFIDGPGYAAIGLTGDTLKSQGFKLFAEIKHRIEIHDGPLFALSDETARIVEAAPWFGLSAEASTCRPVRNNITNNAGIILCPLSRIRPVTEN